MRFVLLLLCHSCVLSHTIARNHATPTNHSTDAYTLFQFSGNPVQNIVELYDKNTKQCTNRSDIIGFLNEQLIYNGFLILANSSDLALANKDEVVLRVVHNRDNWPAIMDYLVESKRYDFAENFYDQYVLIENLGYVPVSLKPAYDPETLKPNGSIMDTDFLYLEAILQNFSKSVRPNVSGKWGIVKYNTASTGDDLSTSLIAGIRREILTGKRKLIVPIVSHNHSMMLIIDRDEKRIEIYDPSGNAKDLRNKSPFRDIILCLDSIQISMNGNVIETLSNYDETYPIKEDLQKSFRIPMKDEREVLVPDLNCTAYICLFAEQRIHGETPRGVSAGARAIEAEIIAERTRLNKLVAEVLQIEPTSWDLLERIHFKSTGVRISELSKVEFVTLAANFSNRLESLTKWKNSHEGSNIELKTKVTTSDGLYEAKRLLLKAEIEIIDERLSQTETSALRFDLEFEKLRLEAFHDMMNVNSFSILYLNDSADVLTRVEKGTLKRLAGIQDGSTYSQDEEAEISSNVKKYDKDKYVALIYNKYKNRFITDKGIFWEKRFKDLHTKQQEAVAATEKELELLRKDEVANAQQIKEAEETITRFKSRSYDTDLGYIRIVPRLALADQTLAETDADCGFYAKRLLAIQLAEHHSLVNDRIRNAIYIIRKLANENT